MTYMRTTNPILDECMWLNAEVEPSLNVVAPTKVRPLDTNVPVDQCNK